MLVDNTFAFHSCSLIALEVFYKWFFMIPLQVVMYTYVITTESI